MKKYPIGIFDSGIGGLTVAHEIKKNMPNESIIYFGDTKHLPYGEKSKSAIQDFSIDITKFLISKSCKAIIIACNSASSVASDKIRDLYNIPVFNVIDPVVEYIVENYSEEKIGVIGTKTTIDSNIYTKEIHKIHKDASIKSLATPLLAPMIEEGFVNEEISQKIIYNYLSSQKIKNIQKLILACTHYPLIESEIKEFYHGNIEVLNSSKIICKYISNMLDELDLKNKEKSPKYNFYVSNYTKSFENSARFFFKEDVILKEVSLKSEK